MTEQEGGRKEASEKERALLKEVQELRERMASLEDLVSRFFEPISQMRNATDGYFKLLDLYIRFGKVSPDIIIPELKDDISKEIVRALFERNGQNISQITDMVKAKRGSASRSTIRTKLRELESGQVVISRKKGKIAHYFIAEEMVRKWSKLLGLDK